jgi:hypothetical protein
MKKRAFLLLFWFSAALVSAKEMPTCNPESRQRVAAAAGCWDQGDFGCARLKIDAVLESQPGCAQAVWLHSFILERDGKKEAAQTERARAVKLDPKLADYWEDRGHYIESALSTEQAFTHFDMRFYGAENRDKAWQAVKYLNEMYNELSSQFGAEPPRRIPVIVYTTMEFLDAWRAPFIGGFFDRRDGKVRLRVDEVRGGEEEFRHVSRHEFTHAFMRQLYDKDLPRWFMEGSAEFYAYSNASDGYWKEKRLEAVRKQLKGRPWRTLAEVEHAIASKESVRVIDVYMAYWESEALITWVAKERGESWIPRLFAALKRGSPFESAFQEVIGISAAQAFDHLRHEWE